MALEGVAVLGLERPTIAHGVHRVVHDAMPGVIDEDKALLTVGFPVYDHLVVDAPEELLQPLKRLIFFDCDVVGVRA